MLMAISKSSFENFYEDKPTHSDKQEHEDIDKASQSKEHEEFDSDSKFSYDLEQIW